MKTWGLALVAALLVAGATSASILIPRDDRAREAAREVATPGANGDVPVPVGDDVGPPGELQSPSGSPAPSARPVSLGAGSSGIASDEPNPRGSSTSITEGAFAEASDGEDELEAELEAEEEEAERKAKERRDREKEREDRDRERENDRNDD